MNFLDFSRFLKDLNITCTIPSKMKTKNKNKNENKNENKNSEDGKINPEIIFQKIIHGKYHVNFAVNECSPNTVSIPAAIPLYSDMKNASMDFEKWLNSLSLISFYLNPNKETKSALLDFVESKVLLLKERNEQENVKVSQFIENEDSKDEVLKNKISEIHPILNTFFNSFVDNKEKNKMSIAAFFGFLKEFKIFPDICNFKLAQSIFTLVSKKNILDVKQKPESEMHFQKVDKFLDINSFFESICIISFSSEIFAKCKSKMEKIDSLMEWLLQSRSLEIVCKRIGGSKVPFVLIENYLRSKESNLIGSIITKRIERETFEDIYNDLDENLEEEEDEEK